jgi:tetratricopeptide (TPR) repeat protein
MLKLRQPRNAYDLLGLPPSATPVQIRARYRQLIRNYKKELPPAELLEDEQFRQWTNAHLLLLSPERREYDRRLRQTRGREKPPDLAAGLSKGRLLLVQAEAAFVQRKLNEAVQLSREAVKLESRNAECYALLGDVLREQGKYHSALTMYNYAIQFDPNNQRYWQRLQEASALRDGKSLPRRFRSDLQSPLRRPLWAWATVAIAAVAVEVTMLYLSRNWGPAGFMKLPVNLTYAALADGFVLGLALAAAAVLGPFDDELVWYQVAGFGVETTPVGIFVALPGIVFFWITPLFYALVAFLDEHLSPSISIALTVCGAVTVGFWSLAPRESSRAVLLLGGNFVFFGFLWGWLVGSIRRRVFEH